MVNPRFAALRAATLASSIAIVSPAQAVCNPPLRQVQLGPKRPVAPDDLVRLRDIGMFDSSLIKLPSPLAISPDGKSVAFLVNQAHSASNSYCRSIMIADIKTNSVPRVVDTGGDLMTLRSDVRGLLVAIGFPDTVTPGWSPDGQWLGYLRRDNGITQLWRVRAKGGNAAPLTSSPVDIEAWAWASNGNYILD